MVCKQPACRIAAKKQQQPRTTMSMYQRMGFFFLFNSWDLTKTACKNPLGLRTALPCPQTNWENCRLKKHSLQILLDIGSLLSCSLAPSQGCCSTVVWLERATLKSSFVILKGLFKLFSNFLVIRLGGSAVQRKMFTGLAKSSSMSLSSSLAHKCGYISYDPQTTYNPVLSGYCVTRMPIHVAQHALWLLQNAVHHRAQPGCHTNGKQATWCTMSPGVSKPVWAGDIRGGWNRTGRKDWDRE